MKKVLAIVAVTIVAIVIGVVVYVGSNLDQIVKRGVEQYGPRYTGTQVKLGEVSSSLLGGEVTIHQFFLGNPTGFNTDHAFKVDRVKVVVDTGSLAGDVIHINEITIDAPNIIYEMGQGSSNLQTIQNNIAKAAGVSDKPAQAGDEPGKKVVIDHVYVRNAQAAVSSQMLGGKTLTLPMPDLHLTDIGKKSNGATMSEAASQVMDAITNAAANAVKNVDINKLKEDATKAIEDATKGAGEQMKGVTDSIKGLLGK